MSDFKLGFAARRSGLPPRDAAGGEARRIEGEVERVVYESPESDYRVLRVKPEGRGDPIKVVGRFPAFLPGQVIRVEGRFETDARFGQQFRAASVEVVAPTTRAGVERYLSSGLVKGVGAGTAKRIVEVLGDDALRVIADDPDRLRAVKGLGRTKAASLAEAVQAQLGIGSTVAFLHSVGLGAGLARRVIGAWGRDTTRRIQANPYDLATEIRGIGFTTADQIARTLGLPADSPLRMRAGVLHWLGEMSNRGHVYVPAAALAAESARALGAELALVEAAIADLAQADRVVIEEVRGRDERAVYLPALARAECQVARRFGVLIHAGGAAQPTSGEAAFDATVAAVERELQIQLAPLQRDAVRAAVERKAVVITGGPGTGKTTIIRAIVRLLQRAGKRIALAAPTGRAARRMAEATEHAAATIHRLLEFHPPTSAFQRNEDQPLDVDWLIVDEASMIDLPLMQALLEALRPEARLVLVGDADQLPSVGPGAVLGDVIASDAVTVVRLSDIFRQAAQSGIVVNAHRVNRGEPPRGERDEWPDFFTVDREDPEDAQRLVVELVAERIPARFGFDPMTQVQVLAPMRRGVLGTQALNEALRARLNPDGPEIGAGARGLRLGDRVMQFANNYKLEVMNGEVGRIEELGAGGQEVRVRFDDRVVGYPRGELDALDLAYACSIHKSQGSEYPAVVIPFHTQHYVMLRRNLLYTAITRGRKLVVVVGNARARRIAVQEAQLEVRFTRLAERLRAAPAAR